MNMYQGEKRGKAKIPSSETELKMLVQALTNQLLFSLGDRHVSDYHEDEVSEHSITVNISSVYLLPLFREIRLSNSLL